MVRRQLCLAVLASLLLPTAASAAQKSPQKQRGEVTADSALVYFLREAHFQGGGRTMFVYADDQFVGTLDNNCYTFAPLPPGKHLLWLNWSRINAEVELEAGKTYYFNVWDKIRPVDEALGDTMIDALGGYCTPAPKEQATSAEHIAERYGKAQQRAAAKPADQPDATALRRREENVAKWPRADLAAYQLLVIEDFAMTDPEAAARKKAYLVETAPKRIADQVARELGSGVFAEVLRGAAAEPRPGALLLRARITQYKPGSETARLMVAGAGAAHLEMTAELVDGDSGRVLATLPADRTWAWGGMLGAARGIEEMERNVAYELALYLERNRGGAPAEPSATPAPAATPATADQSNRRRARNPS
jgi:hypothetical protein